MKHDLPRRAVLAAVLAAPALTAQAQDAWPSRPITLINGYAPGGLTDISTRAIAERLSRELGQTIVVDSRPGGGTSVSATAVAAARPDGYTLLMGATSLAINPALQPSLTPRDPMTALVPVGLGYRSAFVLHVHPSLPARNAAEFIAYAKANPGKIDFGSSGVGAVNHLALELLRVAGGIEVNHIPYRGGAPALIDLRTGRIQAMWQAALEAIPAIRDGATRPIAVSGLDRLALLPDVPPMADTLPGFDATFWQGVFAPVGTPPAVLARLESGLRVTTTDPVLAARLGEQGVALAPGSAEDLRALLARETASWGRLIREQGIRAE
ncbi:Bug family tripartite tricarboxylate transporter substrate binding protein [Humitalea sp. 24SJ18S-53]|uniref:Bug family tripartite tricarboxylate transporter substrate binding protein n=1 Tax=Humitalea sp. 24SJ18S-53 TaxID=3422307 RepID=UPI003D676519